ncbi:DUF4339 domain-containing protein [Paenibacillus bouchesdurhonensis]|uniref:DUF4339 domain-containing protein n=1 Tax=Paenibacillus bouchesdurhonensis TaxID=1870990 RepID=UPI0019008BF3|nr:DUF4339 domain-containing protein [Paenibacillus bouchesdurhonensis]
MGYNYNTSPVPWYYVYQDVIKGPVTIEQMQRDYYIHRELQPNTMVWTEGMAEWTPLSSTELINHIMFAAPNNNHAHYSSPYQNTTYSNSTNTGKVYTRPYSGSSQSPTGYPAAGYTSATQAHGAPPMQYSLQKANNTYMWMIVVVCGIGTLLQLFIQGYTGAIGLSLFIQILMIGLYALFCALDKGELKRAGHRTTSVWWFLIVPVYMFIRAYRLRQFPSYAIAFLVISFVVGFFFGFVSAFVQAF